MKMIKIIFCVGLLGAFAPPKAEKTELEILNERLVELMDTVKYKTELLQIMQAEQAHKEHRLQSKQSLESQLQKLYATQTKHGKIEGNQGFSIGATKFEAKLEADEISDDLACIITDISNTKKELTNAEKLIEKLKKDIAVLSETK